MSKQQQIKGRDPLSRFKNIFAEELVRDAGWDESRRVSRILLSNQLISEGYPILQNVLDFMEQFEGIVIYFQNKLNGLQNDDINFCFERATHLVSPKKIKSNYSVRIGKPLVLIGSAYREHFVLLMSDDNCVYGAFDSFLCKIENSGFAAIEAIIMNHDFQTIE